MNGREAGKSGKQKLAVLRFRRSRPAQRRHLHPDRKLQAPRHGTLHLSQRRPGAPARDDQPASRPTDAAELKEGPVNTSQAGRLKLPSPSGQSTKLSRIPDPQHGDSPLPLTPPRQCLRCLAGCRVPAGKPGSQSAGM